VTLIPVPEVVEHGRTRIVAERHVDLASAVADVDRLDRAECRRAVEERFSPGASVTGHTSARFARRSRCRHRCG
jgi:hypothetical protein